MFSLLVILSKQSNDCDPNEILDDGLICCNYTICNQYCYHDICIKPSKIWFCYQGGIFFLLIIKFVPSIMFTLIGTIVRHFYHKDKYLNGFYCRFYMEIVFNIALFSMINGYSCFQEEFWQVSAFIGTTLACLWMYFLYVFSPFYKNKLLVFTYHNLYLDKLDNIKSLRNFINKFRNFCIVIFGLTGYYMVFDTFAYALNKRYRNDFDAIK